jgi:hypothetical protein
MPPFRAFDHVQLAMPPGEEDRARVFFAGVLEMTEIPKPEELRARGGAWFKSGDVQIHLGVEPAFVPARGLPKRTSPSSKPARSKTASHTSTSTTPSEIG